MEHRDCFSSFHPVVNLLYFVLVLGLSMFLMHPVSLVISLVSALAYMACLKGTRSLCRSLNYLLPVTLTAALLNPMFNHEGQTILTYLPSGNPLTLESILYGMAAAVMLAAVMTWFSCYTAVMTSDKFIYLFGRVIPVLSLLLSMTLRFVPKFRSQFKQVSQAQRGIGCGAWEKGVLKRVKHTASIVSIMVTWSLENAIETADSMKGRGYGLPGRTAFSIYVFDRRDWAALGWLSCCGLCILMGWVAGGLDWRFYPSVKGRVTGVLPVCVQLVYFALCMTPVILDRWEVRRWKHLRSVI